jgi:hypothetical protein
VTVCSSPYFQLKGCSASANICLHVAAAASRLWLSSSCSTDCASTDASRENGSRRGLVLTAAAVLATPTAAAAAAGAVSTRCLFVGGGELITRSRERAGVLRSGEQREERAGMRSRNQSVRLIQTKNECVSAECKNSGAALTAHNRRGSGSEATAVRGSAGGSARRRRRMLFSGGGCVASNDCPCVACSCARSLVRVGDEGSHADERQRVQQRPAAQRVEQEGPAQRAEQGACDARMVSSEPCREWWQLERKCNGEESCQCSSRDRQREPLCACACNMRVRHLSRADQSRKGGSGMRSCRVHVCSNL